jgi:D-alanyl-D-alanine carboxypeptidase (penicillin-binding protein 5/6)
MASLTKLMTALLIVENHALDEWVRVPGDLGELNGNIAHLPTGHEFTVGDLLSALLTASANDAAETLARFHSGSVEAFVAEMNARAEVLGLKRTHYANVAGFDDPDQWSSPRDVAWLALFAFRHPPIAQRLSQRGAQIRSRQGVMLSLTHTHAFLHASTPVVAGKTGTTNGAGQCLLSFVEAGGRQYLVVLLNSQARYVDLRVVLDALHENQKAA